MTRKKKLNEEESLGDDGYEEFSMGFGCDDIVTLMDENEKKLRSSRNVSDQKSQVRLLKEILFVVFFSRRRRLVYGYWSRFSSYMPCVSYIMSV